MDKDTIVAIATPPGQSAIGIIRVSGKNAISIVEKIFCSSNNKKIKKAKSHTIHYGSIKHKETLVDEVLVLLMKAPFSYTKDDTIEITSHGNPVILKKILDLLIFHGARLAEPGEFTKQAFLNGRLNLFQAEAVIDIINAKTESALDASLRQLKGAGSLKIEEIINTLNNLLMLLEVDIDFSEEEIETIKEDEVKKIINNSIKEITKMIQAYDTSDILRNGLNIVLAGSPNTGKSSLLNELVKASKAIVTSIPGTTRDSLECQINIKGVPCNIIDTAGIRQAEDFIEKEGIRRTKEHIRMSHIVVFLVDASKKLTKQEKKSF